MALKYYCTNNECSYPGSTRFEMTFKSETIIDNNNLAATFCPFCKKEMMVSISPDAAAGTDMDVQNSSHPA